MTPPRESVVRVTETRWSVIRRLSLTANVGYDKYEYPVLNERTQGRSWLAGFIWTPSTRTGDV